MQPEANNQDADDVTGNRMVDPQDTEITLGTGKMLVLFFGLVVLCSAFFGLGYKLGRGSAGGVEVSASPSNPVAAKPPESKPATNPVGDVTPTRAATPDSANVTAPTTDTTNKPADAGGTLAGTPTDPMTAPPSSSYFVQVAAVSKQEDADALVDALKKKQYMAFATTMADKLIHVQVGPFSDIKDAEATRAKLVGDGYNPILKK
jgi:DedD protein